MNVKIHEMHECKSCEYRKVDMWASLEVIGIVCAIVLPILVFISRLYDIGYSFGIQEAVGVSVMTLGLAAAFVLLYQARLAYWKERISKNPVRYYSTN